MRIYLHLSLRIIIEKHFVVKTVKFEYVTVHLVVIQYVDMYDNVLYRKFTHFKYTQHVILCYLIV